MKKRGGKNGVAIVATLAILCPGFIAAEAQAQTCAGLASYDSAPFRAVGNGAFNDDVTSFSGGFSYGNTGFFGGLGIGVVNVDVLDGSGFAVSGQAGYETALDSKGAVYLCPLAGISFLSGPNDILGLGVDYSETDFAFGVAIGAIASETDQVRLVPTAGLGLNVANGKLKDDFGDSVSETETFGVLDLGFGIIINRVVSFKPLVAIPFGLEGGTVSFGLTFGVNFGTRS